MAIEMVILKYDSFFFYSQFSLKKMKEMFIVHPSFRLKAVITLAKPLIK